MQTPHRSHLEEQRRGRGRGACRSDGEGHFPIKLHLVPVSPLPLTLAGLIQAHIQPGLIQAAIQLGRPNMSVT